MSKCRCGEPVRVRQSPISSGVPHHHLPSLCLLSPYASLRGVPLASLPPHSSMRPSRRGTDVAYMRPTGCLPSDVCGWDEMVGVTW